LALARATQDGLTDLPNQRAFHEDLRRVVAAAQRHHEPVALAVFDLDDFKFLNDRHGHPHGDALIKRMADLLRDVRAEDRGYRIGGDEFALILPRTDARGARIVVSRIVDKAGALAFSTGISELRRGGTIQLLRSEADSALYES